MNNNYNQFYQPRFQPFQTQYDSQQNNMMFSPIQNRSVLNGKQVESLDVVKAMDIPLDGSISYFPITDGTAIVTKQLQNDGTSKTNVYKLVEESKNDAVQYVTIDDLENVMNDIQDLQDLKDEIKDIKKQINNIQKDKDE